MPFVITIRTEPLKKGKIGSKPDGSLGPIPPTGKVVMTHSDALVIDWVADSTGVHSTGYCRTHYNKAPVSELVDNFEKYNKELLKKVKSAGLKITKCTLIEHETNTKTKSEYLDLSWSEKTFVAVFKESWNAEAIKMIPVALTAAWFTFSEANLGGDAGSAEKALYSLSAAVISLMVFPLLSSAFEAKRKGGLRRD
jgi:hypothetical protein